MNDLFIYDISSGSLEDAIDSTNPFNPTTASLKGIWTRLKNFENLVRINLLVGSPIPPNSNLNIYIDDSVVSWKKGQVVKLSFKNQLPNMSGKSIKIWSKQEGVWTEKLEIASTELLSNTPYIELICIDETNKTLESDIIR